MPSKKKKRAENIQISNQELALRVKPHIEALRETRPLAIEYTLCKNSHDFTQKLWEAIEKKEGIIKKGEWVSVGTILNVFEDVIKHEGTFAGKLKNIIYAQIEARYRKKNGIGDYPPEVQSPYLQFPEVYSNIRIDTWEKLAKMGYERD